MGEDAVITDDETFPGRDLPSASTMRRGLATLVDMVVYCGICALIAIPVLSHAPLPDGESVLDILSAAAADSQWVGRCAGVIGLWIAFWWSYFLVGWGLLGWTPGKLALGLRVVDYQGRCPIGASRAAMRLVAYTASSATIIFGHLLALFRCDCRTLHDVLSGTRVVRWKRR
jgi:uncharacterized RDD family membrane protein YckC